MKDLGCSSNAARFATLFGANDHDLKRNLKTVNWSQALESFRYVARNVAPGQFWLRRTWQLLGVMGSRPEGRAPGGAHAMRARRRDRAHARIFRPRPSRPFGRSTSIGTAAASRRR